MTVCMVPECDCVALEEQDDEIERLEARIVELERDNEALRAEIEALQRMRHEWSAY